jgi:hypothetical protein
MSFSDDHALETYKSLISVSMEGLKTLLLINGGAVVALLAFLGQSPQGPKLALHAWLPIALFVAGVGFCAIAFIGSYATQFALFNEKMNAQYAGPKHMVCLWLTVASVAISLLCFGGGSFASVNMLTLHAGGDDQRNLQGQTSLPPKPASSPAASDVKPESKAASHGVEKDTKAAAIHVANKTGGESASSPLSEK